MRIAVVAPTEIPARRANTMQVMKMTQALSSLGHHVRLAAPTTRPADANALAASWEELARHYGLQSSFPIDWLPSQPRLRRYDFSLRAITWARHWKAELIFTRLPQAAAYASFLGMKTIFEIHDLPQGTLGPLLFRGFLKGKGALRLVVITQALATDLNRRFAAPRSTPFTVIAPDGVDLERYEGMPTTDQARAELGQKPHLALPQQIGPQNFVAGYTGHLYPGRGSQHLLDLAARLPDIIFLIVGGEPHDVKRLREQARNRKLDNVILTGFVPNAELPRLQAACDVLLMPYQRRVAASSGGDISRYLSPMKLFEYLACERAIVSSDLPVLREALNPNNAILLPPDDLDAWADALRKLQADPEYGAAFAQQARLDASGYTWNSRVARILQGLESR
jgi:glycosyltransferase involved in cell wall biosynthesis